MSFSIVTFNVWFDSNQQIERMQQIIGIIFSLNPDVVCLQEVTPRIFLIFDSLLGKLYNFSKTIIDQSYDTLILTRHTIKRSSTFPFKSSEMGRNLHLVEIEHTGSGQIDVPNRVIVGTVHLESVFHPAKRHLKKEQLEQCFKLLNKETIYKEESIPFFLMGDTNLDSRDNITLPEEWIDAWVEAGSPSEHQFTFDGTRNTNIKRRYRNRLDRIFIRPKNKQEVTMDHFVLIGCELIPECGVHPSDHFGIYCQISTLF